MNNSYDNLVFLPDSPYSNWIVERSEQIVPEKNQYVCISNEMSSIKGNLIKDIDFIKNISTQEAHSFDRIIIHYHNSITAQFLEINKIPSFKVIWVLWSGDFYNSPFYTKPLYQSLTSKLIPSKSDSMLRQFKELIKGMFKKVGLVQYRKSFNRIKYIASPFELDVSEARNIFNVDYVHVPFAFLSVDELFSRDLLENIHEIGNKIMIGHCGQPEGNHLEVFDKLSNFKFSNSILCPLSYGDPEYIDIVLDRGRVIFNDKFEPMLNFIPRKQYYNKLSEVGFAIFNTNIQQGFGNILGLIYLGVKVFLNQNNSIFTQLKKWDIIIFKLEEISEEDLNTPLTPNQIKQNKKIILERFNDGVINGYYKNLYELAS